MYMSHGDVRHVFQSAPLLRQTRHEFQKKKGWKYLKRSLRKRRTLTYICQNRPRTYVKRDLEYLNKAYSSREECRNKSASFIGFFWVRYTSLLSASFDTCLRFLTYMYSWLEDREIQHTHSWCGIRLYTTLHASLTRFMDIAYMSACMRQSVCCISRIQRVLYLSLYPRAINPV